MAAAIEAVEDEAEHRGYLRANDCDHSPCIEREAEAVADERARITEGMKRLAHEEGDRMWVDDPLDEVLAVVNPEAEP